MKQYLLEHKWVNIWSLLLYGVRMAFQLTSSFITMRLLEVAIAGELTQVAIILGVNSLAWVGFGLFDRWSNLAQGRAIQQMNNSLRRDISLGIGGKSFQSFVQSDTGNYISLYTNDVTQAENIGFTNFHSFCRMGIMAASSILSLLFIHWVLAAFTIVNTILTLKISQIASKSATKRSAVVSQALGQFTNTVKEQLGGIFVLKVFDSLGQFLDKTAKASQELEQTKLGFVRAKENANLIVTGVNVVTQMLQSLLLFFLAITGAVSFGVIYGGGNILSLACNSILELAQIKVTLSSSKPYFDKLAYTPPTEQELPPLQPLSTAIRLDSVSYSYPNKPVLRSTNMTFEIGKKYALLGPSGCGKTTVLRLLLGQLEDYQGTIYFDQQDGRSHSLKSRYQQMAYIEQDAFLFNTTIVENITLGQDFPQAELEQVLEASALKGDLQSLPNGLNTLVGEDGRNLSGGQKQRVSIARALIHKRSILLVDEGTSALDQKNADIVEQSLLHNPNLTLILISHHLTPEKKALFDGVYELTPVQV